MTDDNVTTGGTDNSSSPSPNIPAISGSAQPATITQTSQAVARPAAPADTGGLRTAEQHPAAPPDSGGLAKKGL
jgi:hypothetical protein